MGTIIVPTCWILTDPSLGKWDHGITCEVKNSPRCSTGTPKSRRR